MTLSSQLRSIKLPEQRAERLTTPFFRVQTFDMLGDVFFSTATYTISPGTTVANCWACSQRTRNAVHNTCVQAGKLSDTACWQRLVHRKRMPYTDRRTTSALHADLVRMLSFTQLQTRRGHWWISSYRYTLPACRHSKAARKSDAIRRRCIKDWRVK